MNEGAETLPLLSEAITDFVITLAERWQMSPFDIMDRDIDDFILIANRLMKNNNTKSIKGNTPERIRVNDKTATGGWY